MTDARPDPDRLLALAKAEEARARRGRLKIFFGFAPGVGKTFAMLEEAGVKRGEGVDVVAGVVETHKRAETQALLEGLEVLPRRAIEYHGVTLHEFDLDAALARRPALILVDELAHTNAPGCRHAKRWQDVQELLHAGIDVDTTVNVQHVESLSDVVAQITGIAIRETVPDALLEQADELELVDLPPEELLDRLREGKVYLPDQAARAFENFFRKGNLLALRELALRRTAERVAAQMEDYRRDRSVQQVWPAAEKLLVAIGPSPYSARLVRATKRMADTHHADWYAISVETPGHAGLAQQDKDRISQTLRLAGQLGAQTATISAEGASGGILAFAREHNVTKIVAGKPIRRRLRDRLFGSIVDELIWNCGDIDIYVISGEGPTVDRVERPPASGAPAWMDVLISLVAVSLATAVCWAMVDLFAPADLVMIYLLAVVLTAVRRGQRASIMATLLGVAAFDFFFVHPHFTFAVADAQYMVTFAVMLGAGLLISHLAARFRHQTESSRRREQIAASLYEMNRILGRARDRETLRSSADEHFGRTLDGASSVLLPGASGKFEDAAANALSDPVRERSVARWVYDHGVPAGWGTDTLSGAECLYLPIRTPEIIFGVLRFKPADPSTPLSPDRIQFIEALCSQTAQALERERLTRQAQTAQMQAETEKMRNALLNSVSHDLRTPLTVIAGSASSLADPESPLDPATRREFARTIYDEARRLDRLVNNLLEMTRVESGGLQLNKEWHVLEEIVGAALARLEIPLEHRPLAISIPDDLPLVLVDELLMEQVLINLIENAIKHTPPESPIDVTARVDENSIVVEVADRGPGLAPGDESRIFEKFYQAAQARGRRGVGLGLTICRSLVEAHGGRIWAAQREGGGAIFAFSLPLEETSPSLNEPGMREAAS